MRRWQFLLTVAPCILFALATNASAASLTLEWDPPSDGATVRYVVVYGTASGSYTESLEVGAVTTARIEGLAAGTGYCFAVKAFNSAGQASALSAEVCDRTEAAYVPPPPPPPPPATVEAPASTPVGTTPSVTPGQVVTSPAPSATTPAPSTTTPSSPTALGVTAPPSGTPSVGSAPTPSQNGAFNLTTSVRDQRFIDIQWQAPAGNPAGYRVEVGTASGETGISTLTTALYSTFAMSDLPGSTYFIRVKPIINGAYGAASEEDIVNAGGQAASPAQDGGASQCAAAPGAPVRFAAQADGAQVRISWLPGAGYSPDSYILQVGSAPGYQNLLTLALSAESTSFGGTAANGTYALRLIGVNGCGASAWGPEAILHVGTQAAELPGAPPVLTQDVSGARVSLSWVAPVTGGPVSRYVLEVITAAGPLAVDTGNAGTSFVHENTPSGQYVIRVRAGNSAGLGPASAPVTVVVP